MAFEQHTVIFDVQGGPVTIDVVPGFVSQGKYTMALLDGAAWTEFGRGDIADELPDAFFVPLHGAALDGKYVGLVGNYAAANPVESPVILVRYVFRQGDQELGAIEIRAQQPGVKSAYHLVDFQGA
jgi:hypothetical protein